MVNLAQLKTLPGVTASKEELQAMHDKLAGFINGLEDPEKRNMLLIMERIVLDGRGHKCTIKFGQNQWSGQKCSVCGISLEQEGQAVWLISRWENSSVMLFLCDEHARDTFEVDADLLTGELMTEIGQA